MQAIDTPATPPSTADSVTVSGGAPRRPILSSGVTDRTRHYGQFYGLFPLPGSSDAAGTSNATSTATACPRVVVVGNCQAESLRIVLNSSEPIDSFRIPPIHEWTQEDMPFVHHALRWANVLVSQPVRDNYRGLPCGTAQLEKMLRAQIMDNEGEAQVIRFPVLRFSALNPAWVIVRSPADTSLNPPIVPYHDITILAELGGLTRVNPADYPGILDLNVKQMEERERAHGTVIMSDYLRTCPTWHTLNHPDNATLERLGVQVQQAIAKRRIEWAHLAEPSDQVSAPMDREMLGHLREPVDTAAWETLVPNNPQVPADRDSWTLHGRPLDPEEIAFAHRRFYTDHPEFVTSAMTRHATLLRLLGYQHEGARA